MGDGVWTFNWERFHIPVDTFVLRMIVIFTLLRFHFTHTRGALTIYPFLHSTDMLFRIIARPKNNAIYEHPNHISSNVSCLFAQGSFTSGREKDTVRRYNFSRAKVKSQRNGITIGIFSLFVCSTLNSVCCRSTQD